ncbi:DUF1801 domain-containing protein [Brachybacterium sp. MASK1Z-5]|uniref:DUF1801 domain-containing protein n=1 Tax=Brachybacterium halotolerans TaxID=2795215 RepID=A0ABS1B7D5_9MICO|nr:DUF1801 domain-containing protein [Brachybacterium halotolerans]MBK0330147.1 DUF1801 domain-containing protein [Brachybacterium halotolerans]
MAHEVKTKPTQEDPVAYCAQLPTPRRREEGARLLDLFGEVTGVTPVMWGPSMIGYGEMEYHGRTSHATWFRVGFSPRKATISLYGLQGDVGASALLETLGRHRRGAGCVYVNGLKDIDGDVVRELVARGWSSGIAGC